MDRCKIPVDQVECITNIYPEYIITNECRYCELFDWNGYWKPEELLKEDKDEKSIWLESKMREKYVRD